MQATAAPRAPTNVFRSTDVDETRHAIARVYAEHELDVVAAHSRLDATFAAWELGETAVGFVRHGAEVVARPGRLGLYFGVNIAVNGSAVLRSDRSETTLATGGAVVMSPTPWIEMHRSDDCEEVAVRLDRSALERELSRMLGRDIDAPVVFDPSMTVEHGPGRRWAATLQFVLDHIVLGTDALDHPLVRTRVEQLLIEHLLLCQRHNYSEALQTGHRPARSPTVRRAMDVIEAHAEEPLTIPAVAQLVGVSVRSLQQGFRDSLGISPLEYQRDIRLARAREDLLAAAERDDGTTVSEIAYRLGFAHLARFAGYYKHRYAELPSQTLRSRLSARDIEAAAPTSYAEQYDAARIRGRERSLVETTPRRL